MPVMEGEWGLASGDPAHAEIGLLAVGGGRAHHGPVTYEEMAGYWPWSTHDYAAPLNEIPNVVFSKSLERAEWLWPESRIGGTTVRGRIPVSGGPRPASLA